MATFNFGGTTLGAPSTSSTNLFGTLQPTTTTTTTPNTGFTFGGQPQAQTQTQTSQPFTFGTTNTNTSSFSQPQSQPFTFGAPTTSTTTTGGFDFGNTNNQTNASNTAGGFNFSSTAPLTRQDTTVPGVGANSFSFPQTTQTPTLFNSNPTTTATSNAFNWGNNPMPTPVQGQGQGVVGMQPIPLNTQQRVQIISEAYNVNSLDCRFKHMLYNRVSESEVSSYVRPQNVNERLWTQATDANPDPKRLVPVQAVGFDDLKSRISLQDKCSEEHLKSLEDMQIFIKKLQSKHELDTLVRIDDCKRKEMILEHRILKIMKKIEVLRCKGYSLSLDEENYKNRLINLQRELNSPSNFKGKLNELVAIINRQEERLTSLPNFEPVDEESLQKVQQYLTIQTTALSHLSDILKKSARDINIMTDLMTEKGKSEMMF